MIRGWRLYTKLFVLGFAAALGGALGPIVRAQEIQAAEELRVLGRSQSPASDEPAKPDAPPAGAVLVQPFCSLERNARPLLAVDVFEAATPARALTPAPHCRPRSEVAHDLPSAVRILTTAGLVSGFAPHGPPPAHS